MKPFIFPILIFCYSSAVAQHFPGPEVGVINSSNSISLSGGNDGFVYGKGIDLNSAQYKEVSGSPFRRQDYSPAYILFKNGKRFSNVPVKFDILHNEIDIEYKAELISLPDIDSISFPDSIYQYMNL